MRLQREERWWHRLATVLFFILLTIGFLYSWAIGNDAYSPVNSDQRITDWGNPQNGVLYDLGSHYYEGDIPPTSPPPTLQKTVIAPDGSTTAYPGSTPDGTIHAEWNRRQAAAKDKAMLLGIMWAIIAGLVLSYLLQGGYRALMYVVYGARKRM
jgi:hypothetical protein